MNLAQFVLRKQFLTPLFALLVLISITSLFIYNKTIKDYNFKDMQEQTQNVLGAKSKNTQSVASVPQPTQAITKALPPRSVYLGMWTTGMWDDKTLSFHPEALSALQNTIGKKVAIAHVYTGWSNLSNPAFLAQLQLISNNGWRPMVSANPYFFDQCQAQGKTLYRAIASGNCDSFLKSIGTTLKQYGKPVFLRFAWEMNISTMDWSVTKTGDSPADYIAAWRHVHDIITSVGATNVLWVFAPNTQSATSTPYAQLYPGDGYVDWVGLDGYNWGTTQSWSSWQSFSQVFSASYNALISVAPHKPLMLSEVNTTDVGGDKPSWYTDMLTNQIPNNFPHVSAIVLYNEDRIAQENVNWSIAITPASLEAFKNGISNPLYSSSF